MWLRRSANRRPADLVGQPSRDPIGARRSAAEELVDETAAFLTGRLAEVYQVRPGRPPAWVWTNLLAHGSEQLLMAAATTPTRTQRRNRWSEARAQLAKQVLDLADGPAGLEEIQRRVLRPLELMLSSCYQVEGWQAAEWLGLVSSVLVSTCQGRQGQHP